MLSGIYRIFTFGILFLMVLLSGCSLLPDEIGTAEKLLTNHPDSTLKILQNVNLTSLSQNNRAKYGVLLFQALEKTRDELGPDSVISYSIDYYQKKNDKDKLPVCFYYKAKLYKSVQQFESSTDLYLKAIDYLKESNEFELIARIYSDLGYICNIQHDYNQAREKYELSSDFFEKAGKPVDADYRILSIGSTYRNEKNYQTALKNFRKVLSKTTDSMLLGATYQEIGVTYYMTDRTDSARIYLSKSLEFPYKQDDYSIRTYAFADYWFKIEKYDSAKIYAQKALTYPSNFYTRRECYRILANSAYLTGDFKKMAEHMTYFQACTDSLRIIDTQTKTTVLESIHETKQAAGRNFRNFIVIGLILLLIASGLTFLYFKLRKRNRGNELDLQVKSEEIGLYQTQLSEKDNQLRTALLKKIEDTRKLEAPNYRKSTVAEREKLDKIIYESCLHYNNWDEFKKLMNVTFNNIVTFLETNYPQISKKEIMLCCFYLCDLSSTDMALILNVQASGVYKLKQRLAAKMNLNSTKDLNQLLDENSVL